MVVISHGVIRHIEVIQIVEIKIFLFLKRGNFFMGRTIPEKKSKATAVREKTNAVTATKKTNMISLFFIGQKCAALFRTKIVSIGYFDHEGKI